MSEPLHVLPINDVIEHEWEECACLPVTECVETDDGGISFLILHHAWDGRA